MFEVDPLTMVAFTNDTTQMLALAGPPTDMPAQVPGFVGDILAEIGSSAGDAMGGIGETISGLTPG